MQQPVLEDGALTLRPFTAADVDWVLQVSTDRLVQQFVDLPTPYLRHHAEFFVE